MLLVLAFSYSTIGEIYVIANSKNPMQTYRLEDIRDFYLGRRLELSNRQYALVYDRGADSALRETFFEKVAGMRIRQVDAYWARLIFAGRMLPLSKINDHNELIELVSNQVNAIGYTDIKPQHPNVKVVQVIED